MQGIFNLNYKSHQAWENKCNWSTREAQVFNSMQYFIDTPLVGLYSDKLFCLGFLEFLSLRGAQSAPPPHYSSRKVFTLLWRNLARFKYVISLTDWVDDVLIMMCHVVTMASQNSHFEF